MNDYSCMGRYRYPRGMPEDLDPLLQRFAVGADLTDAQYCPVALDRAGQLVAWEADRPMIGILQDRPRAGYGGAVRLLGSLTKAVMGDSCPICPGDPVRFGARGVVKAAGSGDPVGGVAITGGQGLGTILTIMLLPPSLSTPQRETPHSPLCDLGEIRHPLCAVRDFEAAVQAAIAAPDTRVVDSITSRMHRLHAAADEWLSPQETPDPPVGSEPDDPDPKDPPLALRNAVAGEVPS